MLASKENSWLGAQKLKEKPGHSAARPFPTSACSWLSRCHSTRFLHSLLLLLALWTSHPMFHIKFLRISGCVSRNQTVHPMAFQSDCTNLEGKRLQPWKSVPGCLWGGRCLIDTRFVTTTFQKTITQTSFVQLKYQNVEFNSTSYKMMYWFLWHF